MFFYGCEYNLTKENFKEIDPPSENHKFDLSLSEAMDTIGIYGSTELSYTFNGYGLEKKSAEFTIDGKTIPFYFDQNTILVRPEAYQEGYHTLSMVICTNSGTGSIADIAGAEGYKMEKRWTLYINSKFIIPIEKTITNEGYLKFSWPKMKIPNFTQMNIGFYYNNNDYSKTYYTTDCTSYVDSNYVGGRASFGVSYLFNARLNERLSHSLGVYDTLPTLNFENISGDSVRIFWKKSPYNAMYKVLDRTLTYDTIFKSQSDTSCITSLPVLGRAKYFDLYVSPKLNKSKTWEILSDNKMLTLGTSLSPYHTDYDYNTTDKVVYLNNVESYDINTLNKVGYYYPRTTRGSWVIKHISCATNSSKVALLNNDSIYVFSNKFFQNKISIPYKYGIFDQVDYFNLTNNDLIAVAKNNTLDVISVSQKKIVSTLTIPAYPGESPWACISMSKDGKYICTVNWTGIKIYYYSSGNISQIYTDFREYRSAMFNPYSPNQLLLTFASNNNLEIRNMLDFSQKSIISLPNKNNVIRNIDPETGNLLFTDYSYLYVLNLNSKKTVFKVGISDDEYNPDLYGNIIFSNTGYFLNISKFLPN